MSRKIVGVTVGTPLGISAIKEKLNPVTSVNGVEADENGNVEITIPASGEKSDYVVQDTAPEDTSVLWVDPDDNYDDGVVAVTGATVGQTVKIAEVDENGVPTAWLPTDFPSGGGGANWKKVVDITMTEAVTEIVIDTDKDGKPFNLWFAKYCIYIPKNNENAADTTSMWLYVNDYEDAYGRTIHSLTTTKSNDRQIIGDAAVVGEHEKTNGGSFTQHASQYISCIKVYCKTNGNFFPAGTRVLMAGIPVEGGNS